MPASVHLAPPATLNPSPAVRALVKEEEGLRLAPYCCPGGEWTIGWGHTAGVGPDTPPITVEIAERYLDEDIEPAAAVVRKAVRVAITQSQFDALVSFVFNIGPGRKGRRDGFVTLQNGKPSTMLALLNSGDFHGAAAEFPRWVYGGGKKLPGLVRRREREMKMFLEGL